MPSCLHFHKYSLLWASTRLDAVWLLFFVIAFLEKSGHGWSPARATEYDAHVYMSSSDACTLHVFTYAYIVQQHFVEIDREQTAARANRFQRALLPIWIQLARQQGMILRDTAVLQMNVNTFHGKQRQAREPLVSTERIMRHVVHKKAQQTIGAWSIASECVVRCGYPVGRAQHAPIARYSVVVEVESQT